MENFVSISNEFLSDFIAVRDNYLSSLIDLSNKVINDFTIKYKVTRKKNEMKSILFNPLNYFNINETLHSHMLADLLNPNSSHGQGRLFLNSFLKKLEIIEPESGIWNVTAEKGRIDILLVREKPHSVIVIENKSNNAVDQDNQLYRYWYQEIYLPNKDNPRFKKAGIYLQTDIKKRYKIIYLPPDDSKSPNLQSLKRPNWDFLILDDFEEELPLKYDILTFNKDICDWLKECICNLNSKNYRLKEYLNQYIELWN